MGNVGEGVAVAAATDAKVLELDVHELRREEEAHPEVVVKPVVDVGLTGSLEIGTGRLLMEGLVVSDMVLVSLDGITSEYLFTWREGATPPDEGESERVVKSEGEVGFGIFDDPLSGKGAHAISAVLSGMLRASSINSWAVEIDLCVP